MTHSKVGLKWNFHDQGILPAWVAEMDFGLAPAIGETLHRAVDEGLTGYPFPKAEEAAARAATTFWRERFEWDVDAASVLSAPDVIEGIRRAIVLLTAPGSPVVLHSPTYFPFYGMVERAGRDWIEIPSIRSDRGRYELDIAGIERAFQAGAGSIVLCNPWNPTGRVLDETELSDLLTVATRNNARIISDEVHAPITYSGLRHTPMARLDPLRVVTVTSASKGWNLPGLKCAQVVLPNESDRRPWSHYMTPEGVGLGVGTLGLLANEAAYSSAVQWFDEVLERLELNRDLLTRLVEERWPAAVFSPPEGTYLGWVDMSGYRLEDPAAFCLDRARVALTGGGPFGAGAGQFVRFNFATDPNTIEEMVDRIATALHSR